MNRCFLSLARLAVILAGYGVAALAASAFLHLLVLGAAGLQPDEAPPVFVRSLVFSVPFVALFVSYFAFVPAGIAILASEVLGLRSWLFHALAGAAVGLAVAVLFGQAPMVVEMGGTVVEPTFGTPRFVASLVGCGIVGGLFYWLCAGRSAGNWAAAGGPGRGPTSSGPPGS